MSLPDNPILEPVSGNLISSIVKTLSYLLVKSLTYFHIILLSILIS